MNVDREWMTSAEVAEAWQISRREVQRMAQRGELQHMRLGRKLRISAAAVRGYERAHTLRVRSR